MPLKKGDRVRYKDGRKGTVYHDEEQGWKTVAVELDGEEGWVIQKLRTDLTPVLQPLPQPQTVTVQSVPLNLKLATISRFTGEEMRVDFWDRDDNEVAVIRATPAELQAFAIRILQQVQYTIEDREK